MDTDLVCWKCGESIADLPMPLGRLAECKACHAELHACRLCEFFDPHIAEQCREPVADFVKEKERANFCDYFLPHSHAYVPAKDGESQAAKVELGALFGIEVKEEDNKILNEADNARRKLEQLFKPDKGSDD
jgi:hypothetical protein